VKGDLRERGSEKEAGNDPKNEIIRVNLLFQTIKHII
jgi:hypothetical protein